jgi:transposase-like protein
VGSDSSTGEGRDRAFGADTIETVIRERLRATIEAIVEEELEAALGATRSTRGGHGRLRELCGNGVPDGQASPLAASNFP